jgi:hypothetical protein
MVRIYWQQLLICTAVDQIANKWLTTYEKYHFALHCSRQTTTNTRLPDKVELARGMKVLVTNNIATDLDITNGARGEIVDIILNPAEPDFLPNPIIQLRTASLIAYLRFGQNVSNTGFHFVSLTIVGSKIVGIGSVGIGIGSVGIGIDSVGTGITGLGIVRLGAGLAGCTCALGAATRIVE